MGYEPIYKKGQIIVMFKKAYSLGFIKDIGSILGYELSDEKYEHANNTYIFETEVGKEREAIEEFSTYSEFIEWLELRDIKRERRWKSHEHARSLLELLDDEVELADDEYDRRLGEIEEYIQGLRLDDSSTTK